MSTVIAEHPEPRAREASRTVALLALRHLRLISRNPVKVLAISLTPVTMVVLLGYFFDKVVIIRGVGNYREYILAGALAQVGLTCIGAAGVTLAVDRREGFMDRLRSMPVARSSLLVGQSVAYLVVALGSMALVSIAGVALGWGIGTGIWHAALGYGELAAFAFCLIWVGMATGLLVGSAEGVDSVAALSLVLLSFLSDSFMPLAGLPPWLRDVLAWNPVSAVVQSVRVQWGNPVGITGHSFPFAHPQVVALAEMAAILVVSVPAAVKRLSAEQVP